MSLIEVNKYPGSGGVTDAEKSTWNGKQDQLISGTNIKTIGGESVLGSGDLEVGGGFWDFYHYLDVDLSATAYTTYLLGFTNVSGGAYLMEADIYIDCTAGMRLWLSFGSQSAKYIQNASIAIAESGGVPTWKVDKDTLALTGFSGQASFDTAIGEAIEIGSLLRFRRVIYDISGSGELQYKFDHNNSGTAYIRKGSIVKVKRLD